MSNINTLAATTQDQISAFSPREAWLADDARKQAKDKSAPTPQSRNDTHVLNENVPLDMKDMSIIRVEPIPDLDDLFTRSMAACEKHQVSANDLEIREIARRHLMGLSRDLIGVFGRDREPDEFTMFVDHWYRLSKDKPTGAAPKKYHRWFAYYLRTVRTAPGEVWRMALAAIGDESLSVGLPDSITSHDRANRAARLLRGLNRFHKGAPFFLSFARIKSALGLPSNAEAGRVCFRLEKAGLVERLDHGTPFDPDLAPEDRRATTWLWHGPK